MRIYVCGKGMFGAMVALQLHAKGHTLVGVSSPAWGSRTDTAGNPLPDRLRAALSAYNVPWLPAGQLRAEHIAGLDVDLIVAAHSHDFIGRATREAAALGAIGYHPSLLPLHRGRDAVRWVIAMRERVTGGSVYWLDQNVDGGPIAAQQHVLVRPDDTAETLWRERLAPLGVKLISRVIDEMQRTGTAIKIPQDEALATWEPSWSRPPIFRPELPRIGECAFPVIKFRE